VTSETTQRLLRRFYADSAHPYRIYEAEVIRRLAPDVAVLDAGCGTAIEVARIVRRHPVRQAIGIDVVNFPSRPPECDIIRGDIEHLPLRNGTVDLVMTRSVMEHVEQPHSVYAEFSRILKPGGHCIMLTPNVWDYASIGARLIPNRFHPWLVSRMEGRNEADTFPTRYRANSLRTIRRLAAATGLTVEAEHCLGQYPTYFMFNPALFLLGCAYDKQVSRFDVLRQLRGWLLVVLQKRYLDG
jgi:SAM-dependent methyltransferase